MYNIWYGIEFRKQQNCGIANRSAYIAKAAGKGDGHKSGKSFALGKGNNRAEHFGVLAAGGLFRSIHRLSVRPKRLLTGV